MRDPFLPAFPTGAISDLVTPFRNGAVDEIALASLVKWQIHNGIAGIVICGQAGEATSLTPEERERVIRTAIEAADGRVPILAGTGTNATGSTIELTDMARQLGATAAVIVVPYYNKPSQEGIFRHFEQIAAAVDIPIVICNIPACTAIDMTPRTLERLAGIENIIGIQDCTGDVARLASISTELHRRFRLYSGHDLTALAFNLTGGAGSISIAANIAPCLVSGMHDALRTGDLDSASMLNARINALLQILAQEPGPATVKQALHLLLGMETDVRLPLTPVSPNTAAALRMALASLPNAGQQIRAA